MADIPEGHRRQLEGVFNSIHAKIIESIPRATFEDKPDMLSGYIGLLQNHFEASLYSVIAHGYTLGIHRSHAAPHEVLERRGYEKKKTGRRRYDESNVQALAKSREESFARLNEAFGGRRGHISRVFSPDAEPDVSIPFETNAAVFVRDNVWPKLRDEIEAAVRQRQGKVSDAVKNQILPEIKRQYLEFFLESFAVGRTSNPNLKKE